jgi:hypothetical protein
MFSWRRTRHSLLSTLGCTNGFMASIAQKSSADYFHLRVRSASSEPSIPTAAQQNSPSISFSALALSKLCAVQTTTSPNHGQVTNCNTILARPRLVFASITNCFMQDLQAFRSCLQEYSSAISASLRSRAKISLMQLQAPIDFMRGSPKSHGLLRR